MDNQEAHVPVLEIPGSDTTSSTFTTFMSGIILGVVLGLFFASYLVKMGRLGGKKSKSGMPPAKEFSEIVKHQNKGEFDNAASLRTGSTQSGSDHGSGS